MSTRKPVIITAGQDIAARKALSGTRLRCLLALRTSLARAVACGARVEDVEMSGKWKSSYREGEVGYVACPLCRSEEARTVAVEWSLVIARCKSCGMVYTRRRLADPHGLYRGEASAFQEKYGAVIRGDVAHTRQPNYEQVLDRLELFRPVGGGSLLDVGPHIGFFMRAAQARGWNVTGVEQSPVLAELARSELGLDVRTGYLGELDLEQAFDVVTFLDVLEHVPDPVETLLLARKGVREGGIVLAKVPNLRWNLLKQRVGKPLLQDRIDIFDAREHLLQFDERTLLYAFERAGLEPAELFVPRPVQTGARARRVLRAAASTTGRAAFRVTGSASALCTDLVAIGRRGTPSP